MTKIQNTFQCILGHRSGHIIDKKVKLPILNTKTNYIYKHILINRN